MALRFQIEILGEQQLDRILSRVIAGVRDLRPVWKDVADDFLEMEREQFASEGRSGSGGWAPLSPRYAALKAQRYPGRGILVRTGALRGSLTATGGRHIRKLTANSLRLGTSVPYAGFHQRGTRRMLQRKVVELSEEDRRRWTRFSQRFLVKRMSDAARAAA